MADALTHVSTYLAGERSWRGTYPDFQNCRRLGQICGAFSIASAAVSSYQAFTYLRKICESDATILAIARRTILILRLDSRVHLFSISATDFASYVFVLGLASLLQHVYHLVLRHVRFVLKRHTGRYREDVVWLGSSIRAGVAFQYLNAFRNLSDFSAHWLSEG